MNDETETCPGTNRDGDPCGHPAGWGTDSDTGVCKFHGGAGGSSPEDESGAPEGNANAAKHNLYADPSKLYQRLDDIQQQRVDSIATALADRAQDVRGELDAFDRYMAERIGIRLYQQTLAEDWMAEQGESNLLIENVIIGQDEEGRPIEVDKPNQIISAMNTLSTDARMWMKDLGLLDDPESAKADAAEGIISVISEEYNK